MFLSAKQNDGEDVLALATRLRMLGNATLRANEGAETVAKCELRKELLNKQLRHQFLNGLRDPVLRFPLSRDPKTMDEAVDAAVKEERNERAVNGNRVVVRSVREGDRETAEIRSWLERVKGGQH